MSNTRTVLLTPEIYVNQNVSEQLVDLMLEALRGARESGCGLGSCLERCQAALRARAAAWPSGAAGDGLPAPPDFEDVAEFLEEVIEALTMDEEVRTFGEVMVPVFDILLGRIKDLDLCQILLYTYLDVLLYFTKQKDIAKVGASLSRGAPRGFCLQGHLYTTAPLLSESLSQIHQPLGLFTGILYDPQHVLLCSPGLCRLHPAQGPHQRADVPEDFARRRFKHLLLVKDPGCGGEPRLFPESIPIQPAGDQSAGIQHPSGGLEWDWAASLCVLLASLCLGVKDAVPGLEFHLWAL